MDVAGEWVGAYIDHRSEESEFPIRARFDVTGTQLTGSMIDERPEFSKSIHDILTSIPTSSRDRPTWKLIADRYPDAVITTQLAADSRLRGAIRGRSVQFDKEYSEPQLTIWSAKELETVTETHKSQPVEYAGELGANGIEIRGTWSVIQRSFGGLIKRTVASGAFWLKKA